MESENLTVIGHTGDLLVDIYTAKCDAYLHSYRSAQRRRQACSIPPEWMLNLSGRAAQSRAEYSKLSSEMSYAIKCYQDGCAEDEKAEIYGALLEEMIDVLANNGKNQGIYAGGHLFELRN